MYIELRKDIVEKAEQNETSCIDVLNALYWAYKHGKHFIYLPFNVCKAIYESKLSDDIKNKFKEIAKQTSFIGELNTLICVKAVITTESCESSDSQKIVNINPLQLNDFVIHEETHLLTENLCDASFFEYLTEYYKRENRKKLKRIAFKYFPLQGGGDTICKVMEKEIELKEHFCLAIVDSDKKYIDCGYGETCKKLKRVMERKPFNCFMYNMENVREIENLIPYKVIESCADYKSNPIVNNGITFDMSYFDMKDGLKVKDINNEKVYKYWHKTFQDKYSNIADKIDYYKRIFNCKRRVKNKKGKYENLTNGTIIQGFGSSLLENIMKNDKEHRLYKVDENDLSESQKTEWNTIGKYILAWCCSGYIHRV